MTRIPTENDLNTLVRREVHYCVSALVSTLAAGWSGCAGSSHHDGGITKDMQALFEQAMELAIPVGDYEEAARQAGFIEHEGKITTKEEAGDGQHVWDSWQEACESEGIEPYEWEVFEHWIVSDWLADKLEAQGEKVDKDFAGLTVWARTTTGQGIASDGVIERIWKELHAAD